MDEKCCNGCKKLLPLDYFHEFFWLGKVRHRWLCKECLREYNRKYQAAYKKTGKANMRYLEQLQKAVGRK